MFLKALAAARTIWLQLGVTFVLVLVVEIGSSALLQVVPRRATFDPMFVATADVYGGARWARPLLETVSVMRNRWQPYIYWVPEPLATEHLNVNEDGLRTTVHPPRADEPGRQYTIAMFGGSTMLGWGARDAFTIPSVVARLASQAAPTDMAVRVTNYGRDGYVVNQEVILLEDLLKRGERPHLVVFYDGINEVESAIARQRAGETYEEVTLRENNEGRRHARRRAATSLLLGSSTANLMRAVLRLSDRPTDLEMKLAATDLDRLADDVVAVYVANVDHVRRLAAVYGFTSLFYWQPILYTKAHMTPYEQSLLARRWYEDGPRVSTDIYQALWFKTYGRMRARPPSFPEFHDISRIFDRDEEPRFIDPQHVGEISNELIARRLMEDIGPLLDAAAAGRAGVGGTGRP
jgi:hypothetical protein